MSSSDIDVKVKAELSRLITEGAEISGLRNSYLYSPESTLFSHLQFIRGLTNFELSAENLLTNRFGAESLYVKHFMEIHTDILSTDSSNDNYDYYRYEVSRQIGILQSVLNALDKGLTKDLFYERELTIFSDLLDQAYSFLENQHTYLAAGVYGRIVLETTIREFAKVKLQEKYNPEMKFDQIIIKLRDSGFILKTVEERLRSYYTIGSDAAHNSEDFKKYSKKDLKDFLTFIGDNVLTLT